MLKATADSNIYISALQFGGQPLRFLDLARAGAINLAISQPIIDEVPRVLLNKFLLAVAWHNLTGVLPMETTRLSTKGQVILPKNIRTARAWGPGTEFTVEETKDGILLRPAGSFPRADLDQVAGCLRSKLKGKTPTQMRAAIGREIMRRQCRGRY